MSNIQTVSRSFTMDVNPLSKMFVAVRSFDGFSESNSGSASTWSSYTSLNLTGYRAGVINGKRRFLNIPYDTVDPIGISLDGQTWQAYTFPVPNIVGCNITWLSFYNIFLFTSDSVWATSVDGISWVTFTSPLDYFSAVATRVTIMGNVVLAATSTGAIYRTNDMVTWAATFSGHTSQIYSLITGNNKFVSTSFNGSIVILQTSPTGEIWTTVPSDVLPISDFYVAYDGISRYINYGGYGVMYSDNLTSWTESTAALQNPVYSVTYGNGIWVLGDNQDCRLYVSTDNAVSFGSASAGSVFGRAYTGIAYGGVILSE